MRLLSTIVYLAVAAVCGPAALAATSSEVDLFREFTSTFADRVQYAEGSSEWHTRLATFVENIALVEAMNNNPDDSAVYHVMTPYADMSSAEFRANVLMSPRPTPTFFAHERALRPLKTAPVTDLPAAFDWTQKNAVTPVKDQGSVGTCWSFSTVGAIEGQLAIVHDKLTSLSTEQIVECDATQDKDTGAADCGFFGGWPYLAYQYVMGAGGLISDEQYPYCVNFKGTAQCYPCMASGYNRTYCGDHSSMYCNATSTQGQGAEQMCETDKIAANAIVQVTGWKPVSTNETEMAEALVATGPLSVLLNAETLQFYHKGIYAPKLCDPENLDHAVLAVGYGNDPDTGLDYWLVKNSWATKWGLDGYFKIERGVGMCGINEQVTTVQIA